MVIKLKKQNEFIPNEADIKVIKKIEYKNETLSRYTIIIEFDEDTYENIIKNEKISIGWDCLVFERLYVMRCLKCVGYNISSKL